MTLTYDWFFWALLSAVFAALTAIFAKVGLEGVDSDLATLIRTSVIITILTVFVYSAGKWSNPFTLSGRTWLFLVLSGLATGVSWVCYFRALKVGDASKVAPVDKLSVVLVAIFAFTFSMSALHSGNGWAFFWSGRGCWYSVSRNELPITYPSSVAFCHSHAFCHGSCPPVSYADLSKM